MLLKEMWSAIGAPKDDEQADIDWIDDLKFYIDNNSELLTKYFFPAVKRHEKHAGHPKAFTIYIKPLKSCLENYCNMFDIEDAEEKFPENKIVELAKMIASEQEKHIENGDYKQDE
jgi:hypothetical protein